MNKRVKIGSLYKIKSNRWTDLYDYRTGSYFNLKSDKLFMIISHYTQIHLFVCLTDNKIYEISDDAIKARLEPLI